MPASFLTRHRTICEVVCLIRELAVSRHDDATIILCDEALEYARRMSDRLGEYKAQRIARNELWKRIQVNPAVFLNYKDEPTALLNELEDALGSVK